MALHTEVPNLYRTGHEPRRAVDTVTSSAERGGVIALQERLTRFMQTRLADPEVRDAALRIVRATQADSLHLENPVTKVQTPIDVSILPIVVSEETEGKLKQFVQTANLVRSAILMQMDEDQHLRNFFEAGVDPIAQEIMRANPYKPELNQWRFRADTATDQTGGTMYAIENNGGEPQGDGIVSDASRVVEKVLGVCLDIPDDMQIKLAEYPDDRMMNVLINRYREVTGTDNKPTIGYFAWRGKSSLSEAEARYTADRYQEQHDQTSIQFDPSDIVDIKKVVSNTGKPYYVIICETPSVDGGEPRRVEIDMVRRLHGEPMENMDLWGEFKDTYGQQLCSDGEETIWDRFTTKLQDQMVNPLNSYPTDKKLDVILGNPAFLDHFGIWDKVSEIVANPEFVETLALTDDTVTMVRDGSIKNFMGEIFPRTYMLRRQIDGLYDGDETGNALGLTHDQIDTIKADRNNWVLKRASLVGHSGTSVHVGSNPLLHEMDLADYMALPDAAVFALSGMPKAKFMDIFSKNASEDTHGGPDTKHRNDLISTDEQLDEASDDLFTRDDIRSAEKALREIITQRVAKMPNAKKSALQDQAWAVLVEQSLDNPDSLIQQAVAQTDAPAMLIREGEDGVEVVQSMMHWDLDPQSIGPTTYTYPVIRLTSATKTNITGGYGALGVPIGERLARQMLAYAEAN